MGHTAGLGAMVLSPLRGWGLNWDGFPGLRFASPWATFVRSLRELGRWVRIGWLRILT